MDRSNPLERTNLSIRALEFLLDLQDFDASKEESIGTLCVLAEELQPGAVVGGTIIDGRSATFDRVVLVEFNGGVERSTQLMAHAGYELRLCIRLSCPSATRRLGAHECERHLAHARLGIFADAGDGKADQQRSSGKGVAGVR